MLHPELLTPKNMSSLADIRINHDAIDGEIESADFNYSFSEERFSFVSDFKRCGDIIIRNDKLTADCDITVNALESRFLLEDSDYEIYTQYNSWTHESEGMWQTLHTGIDLKCNTPRTSNGNVPFFALYNKQISRGIVFHLIPFCKWHISVKRIVNSLNFNYIEIKMGISCDGLNLKLSKGEDISLPEILYYSFENKVDLEACKLHKYFNTLYPCHSMPSVYNTWLSCYDKLDTDFVLGQVDTASRLGFDYFVIDAGWFGSGREIIDWTRCLGDWVEADNYGFKGRMIEVSKAAIDAGMKFGLWLEVERAVGSSNIVNEHPELFIDKDGTYFLDFGNDNAVDYIFNAVKYLYEKYCISFLKLDFNDDFEEDGRHDGLITYFKGYKAFIKRIRALIPELYIEGCSSGGLRTNLSCCMLYDSIWPTDNQSISRGSRMFADTLLRFPPQWFEKWATVQSYNNFTPNYGQDFGSESEKLLALCDGDMNGVEGVKQSYLEGFIYGSVIGFSCDLNKLSQDTQIRVKEAIKANKEDADYFSSALCRVLTRTDTITAIEFFNSTFDDIRIVVFTEESTQRFLRVYPFIDLGKNYIYDNAVISGKELNENGIRLITMSHHEAQIIRICAE